jgi:predicted GIY-YIG superfamily endonuclease
MQIIYALIDPRDGKEFYIGRTEDVYRRFKQHLNCEGNNDAKNQRIRELQSLHLLPIMKTLEIVEDAALAAQRESYWIRHFRYLGHSLSNDTIFSPPDLEDEFEEKPKSKPKVVNGIAAKRVRRILKSNPGMSPSAIARKVGVSRQYASKLKLDLQKELAEK